MYIQKCAASSARPGEQLVKESKQQAGADFHVAPYFDVLLQRLEDGDARACAAFGRHVHWGWWPEPERADGSPEDYAAAAERMCRKVCDAAGISDGMRVLDVGCGFGGTIASLNEHFTGLDLVGVNIDARQLERAARTVRPANGNRIRWVEADACAVVFRRLVRRCARRRMYLPLSKPCYIPHRRG